MIVIAGIASKFQDPPTQITPQNGQNLWKKFNSKVLHLREAYL
jgi:hypothetical protein